MLACSLLFSSRLPLVNSFLPGRTAAPETLTPVYQDLQWATHTTHPPTTKR